MSSLRPIDAALLDSLTEAARLSPRLRANYNFHPHNDFPAHRLLIAIEPGSYVPPHRHQDPNKDETFVILRGRIGLIVFDEAGAVLETHVLAPGSALLGADIPHGTFHSLVALESGSVFLEAKSGPYRPVSAGEVAEWAPRESDAGAADYLKGMVARFTG